MKIYTGSPGGGQNRMDKLREFDLGIMLSAEIYKHYSELSCALDNGAFECYRRGFPWSEARFMDALERAWSAGLKLDFIVLPDVIAGGEYSLHVSRSWIKRLLPSRLALALQDGVDETMIERVLGEDMAHVHTMFIGGTPEWKWATAAKWGEYARSKGKKLHIGRCGTLERLIYAKEEVKADSVDSTNFVRNASWGTLLKYYKREQLSIFGEETNENTSVSGD